MPDEEAFEEQKKYWLATRKEMGELESNIQDPEWCCTEHKKGLVARIKELEAEIDRLKGESPDEELKRIPGLVKNVRKRYDSLVKAGKIIP